MPVPEIGTLDRARQVKEATSHEIETSKAEAILPSSEKMQGFGSGPPQGRVSLLLPLPRLKSGESIPSSPSPAQLLASALHAQLKNLENEFKKKRAFAKGRTRPQNGPDTLPPPGTRHPSNAEAQGSPPCSGGKSTCRERTAWSTSKDLIPFHSIPSWSTLRYINFCP